MASTAKKKSKLTRASPTKSASPPLPVINIPLDQIDPSPLNRDADTDITALAVSIEKYGVQQTIKVRPKGPRFEIVYGERRWRACKKLEKSDIPATVEDVDDNRAVEIRALENLQRKDPHALEEAELFEQLLALRDSKNNPVHTPESIAKAYARSVQHVYNRLKLTALAPEIRKALYKQEVSLTGAFLIARGIPTESQAEAWKKLQAYQADEAFGEELDDDNRLTARSIQSFIDAEYSSRLDSAPFSTKDAKLLPAAGACQGCAKRSGNQPHLFAENDPKDTCTDRQCFRAKVQAYIAREKQRVLEVGGTVMTEDESRRVFNGGCTLPWNSKWLNLDTECFDDPKRRTWRALLGDLCPPPVLAFTSQAKPVLLADKAAILATLKSHGLDPESLRAKAAAKKKAPAAATGTKPIAAGDARQHPDDPDDAEDADDGEDLDEEASSPSTPTSPADARYQTALTRTIRQRIMAAVVAAAESAGVDDNRFAQLVYESMTHGGYHDATIAAVKRRVPGKPPKGESPSGTLDKHAKTLGPAALRALVLELAIGRSAYYTNHSGKFPTDLQRAIEVFKVPATEIEKAVTDELSAKRASRLAGAKPGSA